VNASSGSTFQTFNPANEEVLADIHEAGEQDVERAVASGTTLNPLPDAVKS
jgi:betaine-aldehyde dehydrogenase